MFLPVLDRNPMRYIRFAYVTYGLIALNTAVFLVQIALSPRGSDLMVLSMGLIPAFLTGQITETGTFVPDQLTLVTYAFAHADWLHLLSNMLFLWVFGDNVEDALGHWRFLGFYVACAVVAGLAHLVTHLGSTSVLIGASGAIAGVMGAYVLLYPHARVYVLARIVIPIPLPLPAMWMLGGWVLVQVLFAAADVGGQVAWWTHVGGFFTGVVLGALLRRRGVPLFGD